MQLAHKRNAALTEKFYFRKSFRQNAVINAVGLMSLKDIICGNEFRLGLADICRQYLSAMCPNEHFSKKVQDYITHVERVASGLTLTCAAKLRTFVTNHELYKKDSVISDELCTEVVRHVAGLRKRDLGLICEKAHEDARTARTTLKSAKSPNLRPVESMFESLGVSKLRRSALMNSLNYNEYDGNEIPHMLI